MISKPVLLDVSPPELHHINITKTGRLVLLPTVPLYIRVRYILVHGDMVLGSSDCPYNGKVNITLTGKFQRIL